MEIPEELMREELATLPPNWDAHPEPASTQAIGRAWLKNGASLVLKVPSAMIRQEFNWLSGNSCVNEYYE